jgi:hypothetical protein
MLEPGSSAVEAQRLWEAACAGNPRLFDSRILVCRGIESSGDTVEITCRVAPYRYYFGQRKGGLALGLLPVAVSGALRIDDPQGPAWLLARRGPNVTQYPDYLELVPSGGLEAEDVDAEGYADYRARLMNELQSETGLSPSIIDEVDDLGVITDRVDPVVNILCLMIVRSSVAAIERALQTGPEYSSFTIMRGQHLSELSSSQYRLVPTSRAALDLLRTTTA